jgi:hypothetical protein
MQCPELATWSGYNLAAGISNLPGQWKKCFNVKGKYHEKEQEFDILVYTVYSFCKK